VVTPLGIPISHSHVIVFCIIGLNAAKKQEVDYRGIGKMAEPLSRRELKAKIKELSKHKRKDKCYFNENRLCDYTCRSHSHNRIVWGIKLLQWTRHLRLKKGECVLLKLLDEGKISLKEVKDQMDSE